MERISGKLERIKKEKSMETINKEKAAAIVTGASSGIGLEISRTLHRLGYEVFGFGRDFTQK